MAETVYEGMFLLDSNRYARDPDGVAGQIPDMIQGAGGEMLVSRLWEERRLAYPIKGHRKGTYWLTYFRIGRGKLTELNRKCQLSDSILRALFLKVDPKIVDTLIEHAQPGKPKPEAETAAGKPAEGGEKPAAKEATAEGDAAEGDAAKEPAAEGAEAEKAGAAEQTGADRAKSEAAGD